MLGCLLTVGRIVGLDVGLTVGDLVGFIDGVIEYDVSIIEPTIYQINE